MTSPLTPDVLNHLRLGVLLARRNGELTVPVPVDLLDALLACAGGAETSPCRRCDGCGRVANTDAAEPWSLWESLPPGSDMAVRMGLVAPMPCPVCKGSGTAS